MFKFFLFIIWVVCTIYTVIWIFEDSEEAITNGLNTRQEMISNLRKKVVIDNDTLIIHDFSVVDDTYSLSDGSSIKADERLNILH